MKYKNIIFDLDGTLLNTLLDLHASVNYSMDKLGFPRRTVDEVRRFVGNGVKVLIRRAAPDDISDEQYNAAYAAFQEHYRVHSRDKTAPYDGVCELMKELKARGHKVAIVSNKLDFAVQALKDEFEGTDMKVTVDEKTGAITLDSSVLFDNNKDILKDTGQGFLEAFLPKYFDVLLQPEFLDYISEIIIEGHTDTKGTYLYNLNLSQKRAMSVANFCLDEKKDVLDQKSLDRLREIITANGKSFSTPVYDANGNIDMDASRRVEFKFRLKDDEMIEEMIDILENEDEGK